MEEQGFNEGRRRSFSFIVENITNHVYRQEQKHCGAVDETYEVSVVVETDAGAEPRAVVVKPQNAVVTEGTMLGSRRTVNFTSETEPLFHSHVVDHEEPRLRTARPRGITEVVELTRNILLSRDDSRIHAGSTEETDNDDHGEDRLDDANATAQNTTHATWQDNAEIINTRPQSEDHRQC